MTTRHPLLTLGLWWGLAALIVLAGWCALPAERTPQGLPTPTPTIAITVLPTQTVSVFTVPAPPVASTPDLLPMTPTTRVPTRTRTPAPTETPVPPTPDRPPVQRG